MSSKEKAFQDKMIELRDGRALAYTEHGDPTGKPIFFIHGNPGSRLVRPADERIAQTLGARIITPDRPGYGLSDFQPKRRLLDFPQDMAQLADALGLERFAIFGVSAGGPYVAACAHAIPERIDRAAIVSGPAPFDRENPYEGMGSAWRKAFKTGRLPEWLLRPIISLHAHVQKHAPDKSLDNLAATLSRADAEYLDDPVARDRFKGTVPEATRRGSRGWAREVKIQLAPWGFAPEDIRVPIHLWYWRDDPAIPPRMGHYLAERIPDTVPHFLPGGGHLSIAKHYEEIVLGLMDSARGIPVPTR